MIMVGSGAAMGEAEAVDDRPERLPEKERRRMQRGRGAACGLRQVGHVNLDAGVQQVEAEPEQAEDRDLGLPGQMQRDQRQAAAAIAPPITISRRSATRATRYGTDSE